MIRTTKDFLRDIILGKTKFTCSGYPIPDSHKVVDYVLTIGQQMYNYSCPICGFGQGGSMSPKDCQELRELQEEAGGDILG